MRRQRAFVPDSLGKLEDRVLLSHGVAFVRGAAVLTGHAYNKTVKEIGAAFQRFATKGRDYARLNSDLAKAINRIPFHRVDGLDDAAREIVAQMRSDIQDKVERPVVTAYQTMIDTLKEQVAARRDDGTVLLRR